MHPVFEEILRAQLPIRPEVLSRWQRAIRDDLGPCLEVADQILKRDEQARRQKG